MTKKIKESLVAGLLFSVVLLFCSLGPSITFCIAMYDRGTTNGYNMAMEQYVDNNKFFMESVKLLKIRRSHEKTKKEMQNLRQNISGK